MASVMFLSVFVILLCLQTAVSQMNTTSAPTKSGTGTTNEATDPSHTTTASPTTASSPTPPANSSKTSPTPFSSSTSVFITTSVHPNTTDSGSGVNVLSMTLLFVSIASSFV